MGLVRVVKCGSLQPQSGHLSLPETVSHWTLLPMAGWVVVFFFFFLFQLLVLHQILWAFDFLLDLEGWLHVSRKAWVPTCLVLLAFPDLSVLSWPSPLSLLLPTLVHGETRASFSLCLGFNLTSAKHNSKWFIMTEFFTFLQWNNWMSHFPLSS